MEKPSRILITVDSLTGLKPMAPPPPPTKEEEKRKNRIVEELKALLEEGLPDILTDPEELLDKDEENNAPLFLDPDLSIFRPEVKSSNYLWLSFDKTRQQENEIPAKLLPLPCLPHH